MKKASRSPSQTRIIYILTTIFLVALSFYTYTQIKLLISSSDWVDHTHKVQLSLEKIKSDITDADTDQKSYLLIGDSAMLAKRDIALNVLSDELNWVSSLTVDNPEQRENLKTLFTIINEKSESMKKVMREYASLHSASDFRSDIAKGVQITENVEQQLNKMSLAETSLLKVRIQEFSHLASVTPLFIIVLFLGALLILLISYFRINSALLFSQQLQVKIEDSNKELEKKNIELTTSRESYLKIFDNNPVAMTFGEIGTNKVVYANNLFYTSFGYTKEEVIGHTSDELNLVSKEENERLTPIIMSLLQEDRSVEELRALPHEETAKLLEKLRQKMFGNGFEVLYTRKNGDTFFAIVSYEVIEIGGRKYALTSYQDITDRKKAAKQLEEQNQMLAKINKELESFNYISSHDLQEPLRKIQTFTSRIVDDELENLSDKGKSYFLRMQDAANRMEALIKDLLSYSRTSTSEQKFENVDLTILVEEVKNDFKEIIEERKAIIEVGAMCAVNIIRFQFHQLLTNLIGNALKFSNPEIPPHILISSKIIRWSNPTNENFKFGKEYCHITVTDNGIGFDPQFKERIFEVFQQLNPKEKYIGTGIGLAIVKKIIENHNGMITATSELNKGATFDIYIPAN